MILFGAAGESDSFRQQGYKNGSQMPLYRKGMGLDAFEYQCGRGVRVSEKSALPIRQQAQQQGIVYSLHAPYYISMSSLEEEKRLNSVDYILQSARAIRLLGDPSNSVTDVGFAVGFGDAAHFSRTFKKLVGVSPRAYRAVRGAKEHPDGLAPGAKL